LKETIYYVYCLKLINITAIQETGTFDEKYMCQLTAVTELSILDHDTSFTKQDPPAVPEGFVHLWASPTET
jgi:hypothetical protein